MNVGDTYTIGNYNEETGELTTITMEVISIENGIIQSVQVSN